MINSSVSPLCDEWICSNERAVIAFLLNKINYVHQDFYVGTISFVLSLHKYIQNRHFLTKILNDRLNVYTYLTFTCDNI